VTLFFVQLAKFWYHGPVTARMRAGGSAIPPLRIRRTQKALMNTLFGFYVGPEA